MNEIGKAPGEVSKTLDVTGATLRNYTKQFTQFLSPGATTKTRKRFNPEDIETLKTAKSLLNAGLTYGQVWQRLNEQPLTGDVIDESQPEPEPQPEPSSEDFQPNDISAIQTREFYERFFKPALDAKDETISELKTDKERLQRQLNFQRLPWFRKWFNEPPE